MATAVICEFNPFHNGHKYLLDFARARFREPIVAVMSGSFTQRGEVAVSDKYSRARAALLSGVDLVLEMPVVHSLSRARSFAREGVRLAASFSCVKRLVFGSECGSTELLKRTSAAVDDERVTDFVRKGMKNGGYYPKELEKAVERVFGDELAGVLSGPNDILALEYVRALGGSKIEPCAVKRCGAEHDGSETNGRFASASQIRKLLRNGENAERFAPFPPEKITCPEKLDLPLLYRLRTMSAAEMASLPDVSEGLENRIAAAAACCRTARSVADFVKTKRYTHARIRRILACALLGIDKTLAETPVSYARVLGFTEDGAALLKSCSLSVVTSAARGLNDPNVSPLLEKDVLASDVLALAFDEPGKRGSDFVTPVIKV